MVLLLVRCPKCRTINPDSAEGCGNCGAPLPTKETKSKSSNRTMIIAVIAIIVIVAIVGVVASGMLSTNTQNTAPANDASEVVSSVAENDTSSKASSSSDDNSASTGEYWASSKTDKFHLPTCEWADKISDNNKVIYHSRDDAIEDGKVPCSVCNP